MAKKSGLDLSADPELNAAAAPGGGGGGGGGGSGGGGGKPPGAGDKKGDLFGDQWVLLRDLDPSGGGGDGEPLLDGNGQTIPVGFNEATGETFPIYFVESAEGDFEIPPDQLVYVQEVELERANVARAPDKVMAKSLDAALTKIANGTEITTDTAGRIVVDGVTIDSPLENLALYQFIMNTGGSDSWTDVLTHAHTNLPADLAGLLDSGWDPTGLLAGGFSKFVPITMDAVLYQHTTLGVNEITGSGATLAIDYFSFTQGTTESYDYDRYERYGDVWIQWYQDLDGDPTTLELVQRTVFDAVWGSDGDDADSVNDVGSGVNWVDEYIRLSADGQGFETFAATGAGVNDWAQAVEDARAVIYVMHENLGAVEIPAPVPADSILG